MEPSEDKGMPPQEGHPVPETEQPETSNHVPAALEEDQHRLETKIDENPASPVPATTPDHAAAPAEQDGGAMPQPAASDEATDEQRTDLAQAPEPVAGSPTSGGGFKVPSAFPDQPELEQMCLDVPAASPREAAGEEEKEKDNIATSTVAVVKEEPEKAGATQRESAPPVLQPCLETKGSQDSIAPKIEVDEQEGSPEKQETLPEKGADKTDEAIKKDDEDADEETIPQETRFASQQDGESWDMELFDKPTEKPMVEWESGSNVWYQAHIMKESLTEVFVHFPPTKLTSARSEWIDRRSSRLWRGSLATSVWRYIKDREGAWEPRSRSGDTNSSGKGGSQGPSSSHSAGNSFRAKQRARSTSASRSRLSGRSRSRKRGGASSSSRGSREEPAEDTAASPDAGAKKARRRSAQDVESPPDASHPASGRPPKLRRRTRFALDTAAVNGAGTGTGSGSHSNSESSVRTTEREGDQVGARGRDPLVPGSTSRLEASGGSFSEDDKGTTGDDPEVEANDPLLAWFQQHVQLLAAQGLEHSPSASALFAGRPKGRNAGQAISKETRRKRVAQERTVQSPRYKRTKPETDAWSSRQGAGAQSTSTASSGRLGADSSHHSTKGATGSPRSEGRKSGGIHQSDADSKEPRTPLDTLSSRKSVKIRPSPPGAGQQPKPAPLVVLEEVDIFSAATTPRTQRGA